jgi:hypothetical protein
VEGQVEVNPQVTKHENWFEHYLKNNLEE